eukprot:g2682.t1
MPALISITKVHLENLPAPAQGTLGVVRVKFRAGAAGAETIPRQVKPDGSVEWLETLEIIVHDTSVSLVAVVQENTFGGWSLVPGGRFEGALVTELPSDWHGSSGVPTDPKFHAQLSVEVEDGTQRDTRLPPQAGMDKSGGGFRAPSPSDRGSFTSLYAPFAPSSRGGRGGRGGGGGRGAPRMGRAVSGDSSGVIFGAAYGMGAPSGSSEYMDAMGSPEVYVDAPSGAGGGVGAGAGGASFDLSSTSGASSFSGGLVTATPVSASAEADAILPEPPTMRRASTYSTSSSSTYSVPPARGVPPRRRSSKKKYPGGWIQSGSQDGSFRSSVRMSMSDVSSFSEGSGSVATAAAEAEEPPPGRDDPLPSPVGTFTRSRLLDEHYQLKEEQDGKAGQELQDADIPFEPAYKRQSLTDIRPSLGTFEPAAEERRNTEERVEEVKTERRSSDDEHGASTLADVRDGVRGPERSTFFQFMRKKSTRSRSRGSSGGAASSDSAAGSSETRSFPDGDGRSMSMSFSSKASAAAEAEEKEELEPTRTAAAAAAAAPPAHRQASAKWMKPGRTPGALRKSLSLLKRGSSARGAAAASPPPSAPPAEGTPPTKLVISSDLLDTRMSSLDRPPPTAPPPYHEVMRQRGFLPRTPGAAPTSAGEGVAARYRPELAMSRSRSSSLEPAAAAAAGAAAAESPGGATVLPQMPSFAAAASFSPSAPAAPEEPETGWDDSDGYTVHPSPVDDEAAAAAAAVAEAEASRQQEEDAPGTPADWKEERLVETSLQGTSLGSPRARGAVAPAPRPARRLAAASSETGDGPSDVRMEAAIFAENVYDTGGALGGRPLPPAGALPALMQQEEVTPDGKEEITVPESLPVYSTMPTDSLDGSGRVDSPIDSDSITLYPEVRPRQQLEPAESRTTTASGATGVKPGFPGIRSRQMGPRQLPAETTSVSSESTSISGNMALQGANTRAVPPLRPRQRSVGGGRDPVIFSCFAPPAVRPGTRFDLKIMAYLRAATDEVFREALREGAAERGRPEGMHIAKGKLVTVELLVPEDKLTVLRPDHTDGRPSARDFVWNGETTGAKFSIECLAGIDPGVVKCEAFVIEGKHVKHLSFDITVAGDGFVPGALDSGPNGEVELDTVMKDEEGKIAEVPFEELQFVGELGHGVQGITSHYRWYDKDVAVKSLNSYPEFFPSSGPTRNGLKHEATILSLLGRHPNVVEFYGLCEQGGSSGDECVHIVTKLEEGGSIEDALGLKRKSNGGTNGGGGRFAANGGSNGNGRGNGYGYGYGSEFSGHTRAVWARNIACGLANTHAADVLHNDVASRNALLSSRNPDSRALLCDFGLSKFLKGGLQRAHCVDTQMHAELWPLRQMPCESLKHPFPVTAESDSWMFGLFLYELFAGEKPWAGLDNEKVRALVLEGKRPPKVPEMLKDRGTHLVKLYDGCLSKDSEKRPSLKKVVQELSTSFAYMSTAWGNGASSLSPEGELGTLP